MYLLYFIFLNLVYQNGTLKCFVYINNDQLWITVLEMVCVQTLSICVYSKHRLAKLMLNGRCKWHRKWQPSVTDGCLICLLVFCSLLWITVIWTAASANLFLFNYAVFIMSTKERILENAEIGIACAGGNIFLKSFIRKGQISNEDLF